jgi:hypothetical protein
MVPNPTTQTTVSRRKLIASGATLAVGGGGVALLASQPAAAQVDLSVPDESYSGKDGTVTDVPLSVEGSYSYQAPEPDTATLTLSITPDGADNFAAIGSHEDSLSGESGMGEFGISGSVLDHPSLSAGDFSADAGETTTTAIVVRVGFVVKAGGETVAEDSATDTATVAVENTSVATAITVSADGTLTVEV